jgi:hypothetical protein
MLFLNELIAALRLAHSVGERPHGHFDHDANAVCGPTKRESTQPHPGGHAPSVTPSIEGFEVTEDPVTGELLYSARR